MVYVYEILQIFNNPKHLNLPLAQVPEIPKLNIAYLHQYQRFSFIKKKFNIRASGAWNRCKKIKEKREI